MYEKFMICLIFNKHPKHYAHYKITWHYINITTYNSIILTSVINPSHQICTQIPIINTNRWQTLQPTCQGTIHSLDYRTISYNPLSKHFTLTIPGLNSNKCLLCSQKPLILKHSICLGHHNSIKLRTLKSTAWITSID